MSAAVAMATLSHARVKKGIRILLQYVRNGHVCRQLAAVCRQMPVDTARFRDDTMLPEVFDSH